jgi:tetratricopeptide (TPR) repeat protein
LIQILINFVELNLFKMYRSWIFIIVLFIPALLFSQDKIDSLLKELDKTVANYSTYSNKKEAKLVKLKEKLNYDATDLQEYEVTGKLYSEYFSYKSDSALVYAKKRFQIAKNINDGFKITEAKLNLSAIMAKLGMYKESIDILNDIVIKKYPDLKEYYYNVYKDVYAYMSGYVTSKREIEGYVTLMKKYRDSLIQTNPNKFKSDYVVMSSQLIEQGKFDESLKILLPNFSNSADKNPAVMAYMIAHTYDSKKDRKQQKMWLTISAIHDLKSVNKDYVSLIILSQILFEEGDINRSYSYIRRALDDALFCNARLRTIEISKMMPLINNAFEYQNKTNHNQLITFLISISLVLLLLLGVLFLLFKQMKNLKSSQKDLNTAHGQLVCMNEDLNSFIDQLNITNNILKEESLLKEVYVGRYMDQCSVYIGKLDDYRRKLNIMISNNKMDEVVKVIKSKEFIEEELIEFYTNFDKTFLKLFPSFIEEFNSLLQDNEDTKLKKGEVLNTELRIFALIRLGITDSIKISQFLRYSLSTIYNYRTKLRNKAVGSREEFETNVMKIGTNK